MVPINENVESYSKVLGKNVSEEDLKLLVNFPFGILILIKIVSDLIILFCCLRT